jgi:hypothetical protein
MIWILGYSFTHNTNQWLIRVMSVYKTSIVIENTTRDNLKKLGRKDQTFDDIINELIDIKKKEMLQNQSTKKPGVI